MPSLEHAALVEMFRTHPELIPLLMRETLGVQVPAYETLSVSEAALDQLVPIEFRADLIVEFLDGTHKRPVLSSIVEVQLRIDEAKYFSWPVYATVERSRKRCDTCLIVVAPDPAVAAWARGPIRIGPGNELRPIVLGPAEIPIVTDREVAMANPILAVLSALAHGDEPEKGPRVVRIALEALDVLDPEDSGIYLLCNPLEKRLREAMTKRGTLRAHSPNADPDDDAAFASEWLSNRAARTIGRIKAILDAREQRGPNRGARSKAR